MSLANCDHGLHTIVGVSQHCRDCGRQVLGTITTTAAPPDQEHVARLRLGAWLAAEPGRTWDHGVGVPAGAERVELFRYTHAGIERARLGDGEGPTLAAAIISALEKAQQ